MKRPYGDVIPFDRGAGGIGGRSFERVHTGFSWIGLAGGTGETVCLGTCEPCDEGGANLRIVRRNPEQVGLPDSQRDGTAEVLPALSAADYSRILDSVDRSVTSRLLGHPLSLPRGMVVTLTAPMRRTYAAAQPAFSVVGRFSSSVLAIWGVYVTAKGDGGHTLDGGSAFTGLISVASDEAASRTKALQGVATAQHVGKVAARGAVQAAAALGVVPGAVFDVLFGKSGRDDVMVDGLSLAGSELSPSVPSLIALAVPMIRLGTGKSPDEELIKVEERDLVRLQVIYQVCLYRKLAQWHADALPGRSVNDLDLNSAVGVLGSRKRYQEVVGEAVRAVRRVRIAQYADQMAREDRKGVGSLDVARVG
ncbi:hypothetical protein [Streptomyces sp. NPDC002537]